MLEQVDSGAGQWLTSPLTKPFGRGINLQIDVEDVAQHPNLIWLDVHSIENAKTLGIGLTM